MSDRSTGRPRARRAVRPRRGVRGPVLEVLETLQLPSASPLVFFSSEPPSESSGPPAGLVQDLVPGPSGSGPNTFLDAGGTLFFLASDRPGAADSLWASDGTASGTREVTPGLDPGPLASIGVGSVAFTAYDPATGQFGIWASDGTTAGTRPLASLPDSSTDAVASLGPVAYFEIDDFATGQEELWRSDGTAAGTGFVASIPYTWGFTASGGKLFFVADDGTDGPELWATDGTANGTGMVDDIDPGPAGSYPSDLTDVDGTLYFLAEPSPGSPRELWASDGTAGGTRPVAPGLEPSQLAASGGSVVFTGYDASGDPGIWSSDGTAAGTREVASLPAGMPFGLAEAGGLAFFGFYPDDSTDIQLWRSDGKAAGTFAVATLPQANTDDLTAVGDRVYFTADDPSLGNELWSSDGTAAGTAMVAVINPNPYAPGPGNLTAVGDTLFFDADDGIHGDELWSATAAPSPSSSSIATTINEGSVFSGVGSFEDPGSAGPWTATVNYGDGSATAPLALNPDGTFDLDHEYLDNGVYPVTVTVNDASGASGSGTLDVTVLNVSPTASIVGAPATSPEGTPIALGSTVNDPSPVDTAAGFAEDWAVTKDGAPYASGQGAGFRFTPNDNGTYVVTLTAADKDGGVSAPATATINVFNVSPTVAIAGPSSGVRGQPQSFTLAVTDPSPLDTAAGFAETINWGDGSPAESVAPGQAPGLGHAYASAGTYTVHATATDKDGGVGSATWTIVIGAVAMEPDPNTPSKTDLVVGGTTGSDTIAFVPGTATGSVYVDLDGAWLGPYAPTGRLIAFGQSGTDAIAVSPALRLAAELHGGDGDDVLSGGGGNNILVGGSGNNILIAGTGANVLIGGSGSSALIGSGGDDLLIAGATAYDDNSAALGAILNTWSSALPLSSRVQQLSQGIGSPVGTVALNPGAIVDTAVDVLMNPGGTSWLLAAPSDWIQGTIKGSVLTWLT